MAVSSTLTITETIPRYYEKVLLDRLEAMLQFYEFADKKPIPQHAGKIITFTRYTNFAAQTTALTEGTTPTALQLSAANVTATLTQYGGWTNPTDFLSLIAIDDVTESSVELLGYNAGLSLDTLVRNVLSGGTQ
ncbi:MAG: N4-gp56 family major capsid protein, partial [Planctomycetota bacterium]|nr:N4-gp56 family major capsid protein [Planctomycetota bacterium]